RKKPFALAFLDLKAAFDSVPHWLLTEALERIHTSPAIVSLVKNIYANCATQIINSDCKDVFPVRAGVRQGCPLSPLLFCLILQPILTKVRECRAGYDILRERASNLAYMD